MWSGGLTKSESMRKIAGGDRDASDIAFHVRPFAGCVHRIGSMASQTFLDSHRTTVKEIIDRCEERC